MEIGRALGLKGVALALLLSSGAAQADGSQHAQEPPSDLKDDAPGEASVPPRPPLPPEPEGTRLPWDRTIEIGGDIALINRPVGADALVRYQPVIGYGVHARWDVLRFLRFSAYFIDADHDLQFLPGALGIAGEIASDGPVETIAFGARLAPTWRLGPRARAWASVGIGYGRFSFDRMKITRPGTAPFEVRERGMSFAEVPLGLGVSYDLIRNWLAIELEASGAFVLGQGGEATESAQAIDTAGTKQSIGPLPTVDGSFVQTLGLSLLL